QGSLAPEPPQRRAARQMVPPGGGPLAQILGGEHGGLALGLAQLAGRLGSSGERDPGHREEEGHGESLATAGGSVHRRTASSRAGRVGSGPGETLPGERTTLYG